MIRRTGLMSKSGAWEPGKFEGTPIDALWRDWVKNEMTKRSVHCRLFYTQTDVKQCPPVVLHA